MPSDFSLYRKIQIVLDIAKGADVASWSELRSQVIAQRPPNFFTNQYDEKHDAMVQEVSHRSVHRSVRICRALGLIGDDGTLTVEGRHALRPSGFDRVLASQVQGFLAQRAVNIERLNIIIEKSLRSNPVVMPVTKELWEKSGSEIPLLLFSQMLTLLTQCGAAKSSQRKIYLQFDRNHR